MSPPPATGLSALGFSDSVLHAITAALQGVLAAGVRAAVPSPYSSTPTGKVATLYLLYFLFTCGVTVDGYLPTIWEKIA